MGSGSAAAAATRSLLPPRRVDHRVRLPVDASPGISRFSSLLGARLGVSPVGQAADVFVLHGHERAPLAGAGSRERRPGARVADSPRELQGGRVPLLRRHVPGERLPAGPAGALIHKHYMGGSASLLFIIRCCFQAHFPRFKRPRRESRSLSDCLSV